jgi:putative peptidoglycan lipid II flippase
MRGSLLKSGLFYFAGILLGRIVGLVREIMIGTQYGKTHLADTAVLMIRVPDTLLSILVGGAMSAALIPEINALDPRSAWKLYREMLRWVGIVVAPVWVILALSSTGILKSFGPSLPDEVIRAGAGSMPIMLLTVPFACMSAVATAFLQAHNDFSTSSLTTFVYNLALVIGLVLMSGRAEWTVLATAATVGSLVSWGIQALNMRRYREVDEAPEARVLSRDLLKRYAQAVFAGGVLFLMPTIAGALASRFDAGAVTFINYAIKLNELPLGTLLTVFAVVLFPLIASKFADAATHAEGLAIARTGIGLVLVLSVAISTTVWVFAKDYCALLFGHGALKESAILVGPIAQAVVIGMAAQAISPLVQGVLNALKDTVAPFWASAGAVVTFTGVGWLLGHSYGLVGVAIAYGVAQWLVLVGLLVALRWRHQISLWSGTLDRATITALAVAFAMSLGLSLVADAVFRSPLVKVVASLAIGGLAIGVAVMSHAAYRPFIASARAKLRRG